MFDVFRFFFITFTLTIVGYIESTVIVQKSILSFSWKYPFWGSLR